MCRYPWRQPPLRIWVLLMVLLLTLKGQDTAPVRWRTKLTKSTNSCRSSSETRPVLEIASRVLPDSGRPDDLISSFAKLPLRRKDS